MKATEQSTFLWYCLLCYSWVFLRFESVDAIVQFDRSNKSYCAVLACGTVYYMLYQLF